MGIFNQGYFVRKAGIPTRKYNGRKRALNGKVATVNKVKHMIARINELKFQYAVVTTATTISNSAPYILLLNPCLRGTTDQTRIGDRVHNNKLDINMLFNPTATLGNGTPTVRFLIIKYKNPRGVSPLANGSDVFDQTAPVPMSHFNDITTDWHSRFECVKDSGAMIIKTQFSGQLMQTHCHFKKTLKDITDYSISNAGTVADIDKNAYYLYVLTDTTVSCNLTYDYRFYYKDM